MKKLVIGILAHVDAGKTTLSEGILYQTGTIRKLGRVDNKDAFLDTYELERARGITIFSKQAVFDLGETRVTLLDTPGHVDFSAEMERTLQVLDCAVLVVSGADGVQGHTETLWRLLKRYRVPTFIFVNKMDQNGTDQEMLLEGMKKRLDSSCALFGNTDEAAWLEELAMCDESVLEYYLEHGEIRHDDICRMVAARQVFPCYFGSALKLWGVEELLTGIELYGVSLTDKGKKSTGALGARVYKISRDEQGNRLTHMKIISGSLKVKDTLLTGDTEEKVNQIRIYSGVKYETVSEVDAGTICAVTGPLQTYAGQGLGVTAKGEQEGPMLEPVLTYQIILPPDCDVHGMLAKLRQLEEEEPMLHIAWNEHLSEIQAQVMGEVQIEILKSLIKERFGVDVEFGAGHIVYKETITAPIEGVGHFEPLRHYAEVHLLMEPVPKGSGLIFDTTCSTDELDLNWQRLILTHLEEKRHIGVLTGAEITDMRISLIVGRAHLKHTEGGDFRQATYRAVRQGLREACALGQYQLLEPYYRFRLEIPVESVGRAMADLERMHSRFEGPELEGDMAVITGEAPVATMGNYQMEVSSYSRGRGKLHCGLKGYELCHNAEEVVFLSGYDPDLDMDEPCGSVFCSHGAGYYVDWYMVKDYMHLESPVALTTRRVKAVRQQDDDLINAFKAAQRAEKNGKVAAADREQSQKMPLPEQGGDRPASSSGRTAGSVWGKEDKDLETIFTRTYGEQKRKLPSETGARRVSYDTCKGSSVKEKVQQEEYLLVDGYNIIFAWEGLRELANTTIDGARHKLMDIMCNYQGFTGCILILVFDAYKVEGNLGQAIKYHNINVVYTKEAETADQYIEKLAHQMGRSHHVTVATSDGLEQLIIRGQGCRLMSAQDLKEAVEYVNHLIRSEHLQQFPVRDGNYLLNHADGDLREYLEDVRLGKEGEYHGGKADKK